MFLSVESVQYVEIHQNFGKLFLSQVEGTKVLLARIVARLDEDFVYQAENLSPRKRWDSAERKKLRFWAADRTVDFWKSILSFCNFFDFHHILKNEYFLKIPKKCLKNIKKFCSYMQN